MSEKKEYYVVENIAAAVDLPKEGILTRPIHDTPEAKGIMFAFSKGQELSEHTASVPAIIHLLEGTAVVGLGEEKTELGPGGWVYMAPNLKHSILAMTDVKLLLLMLKGCKKPE